MTITEAQWTAARPDCPNPEYWHAPDPDSTEMEVSELVGAFVRALQPEIVVETGTAWAQTAIQIGVALQANGHGEGYSLETEPDRVKHCRLALEGLPVRVVQQASLDWTPPEGVGFAWFDSLIPLRVAEFRAYAPYMRPGAVVGFHDCGPLHGLRGPVEELARDGRIRPIYLPTPRGVIFAEVT